jgi:hypothetical protein
VASLGQIRPGFPVRRDPALARRDTTGSQLAGVLWLVAGVIASVAAWEGTPLPATVVALALVTTRLAPHAGWLTAWAVAATSSCVLAVTFLRFTPCLGVELATSIPAALTAAVVGIALGETIRPSAVSYTRLAVPLAISASLPTALFAFFIYWNRHTSGTFLVWGMNNDVVSRLVQVRRTTAAQGFVPEIAPSDPLTTALNVMWSVPGTPSGRGAALRHVILREEQIWILIWLAAGLTLSAMAVSALAGRPWFLRLLASILAAALPATWFVSGYSFTYGFQNAGPSVLLLVLAWQLWRASRRHPTLAVSGMVLVTVALVMTWPPLASVPAALLAAIVVTRRTKIVPTSVPQWAAIATSGAIAALSAGFAYQDITANVSGLSLATSPFALDGPVQDLRVSVPIGIAVAGLVAGLVWAARQPRARGTWIGAFFALVGAGVMCCYLLYTRRDSPELWGYYPVKFVWLLTSAVLGLATVGAFAAVARRGHHAVTGLGLLAAAATSFGVMVVTSPAQPLSWSMAAPVAMHNASAGDYVAARMLQVYDEKAKTLMAGATPAAPYEDYFVNFWTLHLSVDSADDSIRGFAYTLDPQDPRAVCETIRAWGPGVRVVTATDRFASRLRSSCRTAELDYTILVTDPARAG